MLTYKDFVKFILRSCLIKNFGFGKLPIVDAEEMEDLIEDYADDMIKIEEECLNTCYGEIYPPRSLYSQCLAEVLVEGRDELWGIMKDTLDRLLLIYPEMKTSPPISAPTWIDHEHKYTISQFHQCEICLKTTACLKVMWNGGKCFGLCCCCMELEIWQDSRPQKFCTHVLRTRPNQGEIITEV